jgi:osmoprotectant transport system substrate-binding protein
MTTTRDGSRGRSAAFLALLAIVLPLLFAACSAPSAPAAQAPAAGATAAEATAEATAEAAADTGSTGGTAAQAEGSGAPPNGPVRIGSKDFTEAILVAELYAQVLERAGFTVERKFNLGATPIAHAALLKGDIDLYPEYTSTGLQEVLKDTNRYDDAAAILDAARSGYEQQFGATWLDASPFNNTNVFATTADIAQQYGLKTISDLAAHAADLRLGGPAEFPDRVDTQGLDAAYGGFVPKFKEFKPLGTGALRYDALQNGEVDVIVAFGTDGRIAGDKLVVLEDDKNFYPIYNIAPVVRQDTLTNNPGIADALNVVAPLLTNEVMAGLNYQVDGPEKAEPGAVITAFLDKNAPAQ